MNRFQVAATAILSCLVLETTAAPAGPDAQPVHLDMMETCHKGLVVWLPRGSDRKCGQFQTPQVKVFDGTGRLRFAGTGMDALQWAKAGMPSTPIPVGIVVRDAASEARITHVAAPRPGNGWVTYYVTKPCPPCETQLATLRADVIPALGGKTQVPVFDLY